MAVWIFERDVFDADLIERMVAHCMARGIAHRLIRISPAELVVAGRRPALPPGEPVICYASIGAEVVAAKMSWTPGVFGGAFQGAAYRTKLGDLCLNHDATVLPISEVARRLDPARASFAKPDADSKEFAGRVFGPGSFGPWLEEMRRIGYLSDVDFAVAISEPKTLEEEYRLVVVEGRVVAGSLYKRKGQTCVDPRFPHDTLQAFVSELETRFKPATIYDVDVAATPDGWRVVEYSTFNTSSLYACDVGAMIDAITAIVDAGR